MLLRASILLLFTLGCGTGPKGKLVVDTPIAPFQPLDADELAGIEPPDEDEPVEDGPKPAPPPAPKQ
jgi:hypothetical protein